MDLFDSLEKRIKRDKRFDNPRSDLCKEASILMRSRSSDQINLVEISVEVGHLCGFKRILKTSIDHQIMTLMDYKNIHGSSNRSKDLPIQRYKSDF